MHKIVRWPALGAAVVVLAACSHPNRNAPLAYVPADTPYVVANLAPLTDQATAGLFPASASTTLWHEQMARWQHLADRMDASGGDSKHLADMLHAILGTFRGKTYAQVSTAAGVDPHGLFAMYGLGLSPVMRGQLTDAAKFHAYVAKLAKAYGLPLTTAKLGERIYQHIPLGKSGLQLLVATHAKHFVVAELPAAAGSTQLRLVLGIDHPKQSLQASGRLAKIAKAEGYGPYLAGYVDTTKLPALLAGAHDPLLQAILHAASREAGHPVTVSKWLPAACKPGLARIAARVPMISFGYTKLDAKEKGWQMDVHLAPDIVKAFQGMGTQVAGLGKPSHAPLDFAMTLPVPAIRSFWLAQAEAVAAKPFICPALTGLNKAFAKLQQALPRTAMPPFGELRGFRLILDQADFTATHAPAGHALPRARARLLIASHNPRGLWSLAKAHIPAFAQLKLKDDGRPVALPSTRLTGKGRQPAWVAMGKTALAIGTGQGEQTKLSPMLQSGAGSAGTLLHWHMSGTFYAHALRGIIDMQSRTRAANAAAQGGHTGIAPFNPQLTAMLATAKRVQAIAGQARLTSDGLRISSDMRRK